jgi:hypothetical protein
VLTVHTACNVCCAAGQLCVTRSHPGQPRPYTGVVNIVSGEIAEDLATYLVGWQHPCCSGLAGLAMGLHLRQLRSLRT